MTPSPPASIPASIVVLRNPLKPFEREEYAPPVGTVLIDWLVEHYPAGFGRPVVVARNNRVVDLAEADFALEPGDVVTVLVNPGLPAPAALASIIITAILTAAATAAITLALNLIFGKPSRPKAQDAPGPDPIYSISGSQNAARVGDPIPALYGRMISTPDYASQPYTFFAENQQYLDQILCLGWGEFVIHDVRIGETPLSALEGDAVEWWQYGPADHGQAMGPIEALTGVMENVISSPEVADQELNGAPAPAGDGGFYDFATPATFTAPSTITLSTAPFEDTTGFAFVQVSGTVSNNGAYTIATNGGAVLTVEEPIADESTLGTRLFRFYNDPSALSIGPFVTCAPGKLGDRIMADFIFPQGLYAVDDTTGALLTSTVTFTLEYQQITDEGDPVGGWASYPITVSRATNTPQRLTFAIDVAPGRYRVRARRDTAPAGTAREVSNLIWTGLKFRVIPSVPPIYGAVTLIVIRIRATNGIAGAASTRVSADVTRKLPSLGSGPLAPSTSPADAFCDIYTNPIYGARRPLAEVDTAELARLVAHWGGAAQFNGGFAQRSTVWEALKMSVQTAAASPLPLGQLMSIAQDGTRALRTQLFSDANMIRGSLSIGYNFDRPGDYDGIEVEYRDPATWNARSQVWPPGALDADLVQLFGGTDSEQALGHAKLLWNKRLMQRKTATFETDLEGLIPRLGDRIALAAQLPRWARAGVVVAIDGLTLRLDDDLDWSGTGHFVILRNERGEPSEPIAVVPGAEPGDLILAALPPFPLYGIGSQEPTHYAFGTAEIAVRDFTVANIEHRGGNRVGIEAVIYDPAIFASTLPWLEVPV